MAYTPFIRYIVKGPGNYWWRQFAETFLNKRGWNTINPKEFSFTNSYGYDPKYIRTLPGRQIADEKYALDNASIVVEYQGEPQYDSVFYPLQKGTIVDDLLAFMSLYIGVYCQYLWKESMSSANNWKGSLALQINNERTTAVWAGLDEKAIFYFEQTLNIIPTLNPRQLELSMRWFFSALKEMEVGRLIVETALNWVCLEVQAKFLGIEGKKDVMVKNLLQRQGFPAIPLLDNFYRLRNNAFHDGKLSNLSEPDAQAACIAGRALVRAHVLIMLGMTQGDFDLDFVRLYS